MTIETQNGNIKVLIGSLPEGGGSLSRTFADRQENCSCLRGKMGGESCAEIYVKAGPKLILQVRGGIELHAQVKAIESYSGDRIASSLIELAENKLREESNDFIKVLNDSLNTMYYIARTDGRNSLRGEFKNLLEDEYNG